MKTIIKDNVSTIKKISWYNINNNGDTEEFLENKPAIYVYMKTCGEIRYYVGSSIKLKSRFNSHRRGITNLSKNKNNRSGSPVFYNSVMKYGWESFKFGVLEYIDLSNITSVFEKKIVILGKEQYYLDIIKPSLNVCKTAGSVLGVKHSESYSINLSKIKRGKKIVRSTMTVNVIPRIMTNEIRLKQSSRSHGIRVKVFDHSNNLLNEFSSIERTAKHYGVTGKTIRKIHKSGKSYDDLIYKFETKLWYPILVKNIESNLIEEYISSYDVAKNLNIPRHKIMKYINTNKLLDGIYLITRKKDLDK